MRFVRVSPGASAREVEDNPAEHPPLMRPEARDRTKVSERSANLTLRHSSLRWKLQMACGEVDEITGLVCPGVWS